MIKVVALMMFICTSMVQSEKLKGKACDAYVVSGKAEYIGPYFENQKHVMDGYNGPAALHLNPYRTNDFFIFVGTKYYEKIEDITNVVEAGPEFYKYVTFEVHTFEGAIFNVKITDNYMFIEPLMHRWATKTRMFGADFPEEYPEEAQGANHFAFTFHRQQPSHFTVEYMKDLKVIHSVPLKYVNYKPSQRVVPGDTNRKYLDVVGESVDGIRFITPNKYSYSIQQSVKYYLETNKFYPLKMKIILDKNTSWLQGSKFKYDVTNKKCYIITASSKLLLKRDSAKFILDGDIIKILVIVKSIDGENGYYIFAGEKYGVLIENDAKKCGIHHNMKKKL